MEKAIETNLQVARDFIDSKLIGVLQNYHDLIFNSESDAVAAAVSKDWITLAGLREADQLNITVTTEQPELLLRNKLLAITSRNNKEETILEGEVVPNLDQTIEEGTP